jgi:hypothetical protein
LARSKKAKIRLNNYRQQKTTNKKNMPALYTGPKKEIKKLPKWLMEFATLAEWAPLRAKLREESIPKPPAKRRQKSRSFLAALEKQFPSMSGCNTDISCVAALFQGGLRLLPKNKATLKALLQAVNKVVALQYPQDDQLVSYRQQVTILRNLVKKQYPKKIYEDLLYVHLAFAGGSEEPDKIRSYKVMVNIKASKALDRRINSRTPATEVMSHLPFHFPSPPLTLTLPS